ncbi:MAG: T9SS type A sorting domain-containing protein [Chitinophagaceae bacterium]|nr:MAG: T9SS type A sorting domain-containing protein [Chitinophagaceae bacterium]
MKKIYSIVSIISLSLFSLSASAQSTLPTCTGNVTVFYVDGSIIPGTCGVFMTGAPAGATVRVFDAADNDITVPGTPPINNSGGGLAQSVCGTQAAYVILTSGGVSCQVPVNQDIVTPIKLASFSAFLKNSSVTLNWTSDQEFNSSVYSIERSNDGKNFSAIGTVKAAGISYSPLKYSFDDNSFSGTAYYRLKMIDIDGTFEYSKVVYVNGGSGANGTLSVFPNPFRSDVQLKGINASDVNKANIRIFSAAGKEVNFKVSGANSISIDPSVPQGIYMLRVKGQTYKLVKE